LRIKLEWSINGRLSIKVYNNRFSSKVTYKVNKTDDGWYVSYIAMKGDCTPDEIPYFYANFDQNYINYPCNFNESLEWLWEQIDNGEIDREEAQKKLQELADWVSICENSTPKWKGWNS